MSTSSTGATTATSAPPYPRVGRGASVGWRRRDLVVAALHLAAFALTEVWIAVVRPDGWRGPAVAVGALWLLIGPLLVVNWEEARHRLVDQLDEAAAPPAGSGADPAAPSAGRSALDPVTAALVGTPPVATSPVGTSPVVTAVSGETLLSTACAKVHRWRLVIVAIPVLLMAFTPWTSGELADALHLTSWNRLAVTVAILCLGGVTGGYALWAATKTIVIARAVARQPIETTWSPFSGGAAASSEAVARFCFTSALLFGVGGTCLLPGLLAGALNSDGTSSSLLIVVMSLIIGTVISLLAVPAVLLSSRSSRSRDAYLDLLAKRIDRLEAKVVDDDQPIESDAYLRLRSLLELRLHVVGQPLSPASVNLVKKIPLAIVLPLMSTGAAWLALI